VLASVVSKAAAPVFSSALRTRCRSSSGLRLSNAPPPQPIPSSYCFDRALQRVLE
jgi:hypothetical protein